MRAIVHLVIVLVICGTVWMVLNGFGIAPSFLSEAPKAPITVAEADRECMSYIVYWDAGRETETEQLAVAVAAYNLWKRSGLNLCVILQRFLNLRKDNPGGGFFSERYNRHLGYGKVMIRFSDENQRAIQEAKRISGSVLESRNPASLLPVEYAHLGCATKIVRKTGMKKIFAFSQRDIDMMLSETKPAGKSPGTIEFRCPND